jgi:hypothetical protein
MEKSAQGIGDRQRATLNRLSGQGLGMHQYGLRLEVDSVEGGAECTQANEWGRSHASARYRQAYL